MDHKGGDVSHGIIAPSRDYSPGSHVNPRSPRDSQYRNIRQPSGFTTHAAPNIRARRKVSRDSLVNTIKIEIKIKQILVYAFYRKFETFPNFVFKILIFQLAFYLNENAIQN